MHISLFWSLSNQFTQFFINTLFCVAMVTILAMYILQQMWLCAADCNLGYMNKIVFTSIAFDYLLLIVKVNRSVKKYQLFLGNLIFLIVVSMVTAEDPGTLLFPIGYRHIA